MSAVTSDATSALLRAIRQRIGAGAGFRLEEIKSRTWASATFVGARHELTFSLGGADAAREADAFLVGLEVAEFRLRGHILADIALVARTDEEAGDDPRVRIALEALTVEDA